MRRESQFKPMKCSNPIHSITTVSFVHHLQPYRFQINNAHYLYANCRIRKLCWYLQMGVSKVLKRRKHTNTLTHHTACCKILSAGRLCDWAWSQSLLCHCCLSVSLTLSKRTFALLVSSLSSLLLSVLQGQIKDNLPPHHSHIVSCECIFCHLHIGDDETLSSLLMNTLRTHLANCPSEVD